MNILKKYKKDMSDPLKSMTIKIPQEQFDAIKKQNINLGAFVRDMLDQSDLMQTYRKEQQISSDDTVTTEKSAPTETGFSEDLFKFEHEGIRFYYLNPTTMFEMDSNNTITKINKGLYYKIKKLAERESENV